VLGRYFAKCEQPEGISAPVREPPGLQGGTAPVARSLRSGRHGRRGGRGYSREWGRGHRSGELLSAASNAAFLEDGTMRYVIIDMTSVHGIDGAACHASPRRSRTEYHQRGIKLALANPNKAVMAKLEKAGLPDFIGRDWFFVRVYDAVKVCRAHMAMAGLAASGQLTQVGSNGAPSSPEEGVGQGDLLGLGLGMPMPPELEWRKCTRRKSASALRPEDYNVSESRHGRAIQGPAGSPAARSPFYTSPSVSGSSGGPMLGARDPSGARVGHAPGGDGGWQHGPLGTVRGTRQVCPGLRNAQVSRLLGLTAQPGGLPIPTQGV